MTGVSRSSANVMMSVPHTFVSYVTMYLMADAVVKVSAPSTSPVTMETVAAGLASVAISSGDCVKLASIGTYEVTDKYLWVSMTRMRAGPGAASAGAGAWAPT